MAIDKSAFRDALAPHISGVTVDQIFVVTGGQWRTGRVALNKDLSGAEIGHLKQVAESFNFDVDYGVDVYANGLLVARCQGRLA